MPRTAAAAPVQHQSLLPKREVKPLSHLFNPHTREFELVEPLATAVGRSNPIGQYLLLKWTFNVSSSWHVHITCNQVDVYKRRASYLFQMLKRVSVGVHNTRVKVTNSSINGTPFNHVGRKAKTISVRSHFSFKHEALKVRWKQANSCVRFADRFQHFGRLGVAGGQRYVAHDGALVAERYTPAVISAVKLAPKAPEISLDDQTG